MRIGVQGPRKDSRIAGAATFEQELFDGIISGIAGSPHILVVFSKHPRPSNLANGDRIEWIQLKFVGLRNLKANAQRILNQAFNNVFRWPSPFRNEHWIDSYLYNHRVEFFLNLIPETIPTEVPYMTFIWDLLHRGLPFFPECSQRGASRRRENQLSEMIRRAAILAVGTEVGRKQLMKYYPVSGEHLHVLPFPTPGFALRENKGDKTISSSFRHARPYLFYPSSFHAHKNHVTILLALALLRKRGIIIDVVFSGGDWGNLAHIEEMIEKLALPDQVHLVGFVSRIELVEYYRGAIALVFPSLLGPDNIPPLEAFGLGCPAIVADIEGAREQLEDAALLFSPTDEQALADAILKLQTDTKLRDGLIEKGKIRAKKFNGDDMGKSVLTIIEDFQKVRRCWGVKNRYPSRFNFARLFGG